MSVTVSRHHTSPGTSEILVVLSRSHDTAGFAHLATALLSFLVQGVIWLSRVALHRDEFHAGLGLQGVNHETYFVWTVLTNMCSLKMYSWLHFVWMTQICLFCHVNHHALCWMFEWLHYMVEIPCYFATMNHVAVAIAGTAVPITCHIVGSLRSVCGWSTHLRVPVPWMGCGDVAGGFNLPAWWSWCWPPG